jgi:cytochrome c oxidase subunit 3
MLLAFTLVCAAVFLGIKYVEYSHKFHLGLLPGIYYAYDGSEGAIVGKNPHIFFGIYFAMTGIHALHVIAGMAVIAWMLVRTAKGDFSAEYYTPLEMSGLYWHLVDIIWIFVFTLLYLIG